MVSAGRLAPPPRYTVSTHPMVFLHGLLILITFAILSTHLPSQLRLCSLATLCVEQTVLRRVTGWGCKAAVLPLCARQETFNLVKPVRRQRKQRNFFSSAEIFLLVGLAALLHTSRQNPVKSDKIENSR